MASHLVLALALSAPLAGSLSRAAEPTSDSKQLFRRTVQRAVDRAQASLERSTELWTDHSTWENAWAVQTQNFEVRTTHSRHLAADLAQGLEVMLGHFQLLLGTDYEPSEPFQIFVLPGMSEYNDFGNNHGAEHSSLYGSFFANQHPERPVATLYTDNAVQLRMWVTHAALHQFLDQAYSRQPPTWVSEGLASYFAQFWDQAYGQAEIERIVAGRRADGSSSDEFVPLRALIQDNLGAYTDRSHNRFIQLGALFNYLLAHREDTRTVTDEQGETVQSPFADYLRKVVGGGNYMMDPLQGLIVLRPEDLEIDFRAFYGD